MAERRTALYRLGPVLAVALLAGPLLCGLAGTVLPAFGYLPALGGRTLSLDPFRQLLAEPGLARGAVLALTTGLAATALSVAVIFLFVAGWAGTRLFSRFVHLVSPLLAVPHAAAAFGLVFLAAPSGFIARLISPELTGWERPPDLLIVNDPAGLAMTAGLAAKEIPFLMLIALAALPQIEVTRTLAIAASAGYGRMAGFLLALWPRLYRQIRLAVFAVLAFGTSVVDVGVILGPTAPPPLAVQVTRLMQDPDLSMRFTASAGALLQLAVTGLALLAWLGLEHVGAMLRRQMGDRGRRFRRDAPLRLAGLGAIALTALVTFAGLGLLALWSVAGQWPFPDALPASLSLDSWASAASRIGQPLWSSLSVGLAATALALAVTVLCLANETETGRRTGTGAALLIYLPLIVPQAGFLFGLQLLFLVAGLGNGWPALVLSHLVFVLPYVFLSLADPWRALDRRYEAVAAGLGKGRLAALTRVRLPMLTGALATAAAVGFAVSVGLYLPTLLVAAGRIETVTTEAVALAAGGNRRVIGVYAFLQLALPAAGFAIATAVPALLFRQRRALRGGASSQGR